MKQPRKWRWVFPVRIPKDLVLRIARLAQQQKRNRSRVAEEAIELGMDVLERRK